MLYDAKILSWFDLDLSDCWRRRCDMDDASRRGGSNDRIPSRPDAALILRGPHVNVGHHSVGDRPTFEPDSAL